MQAQAKQRASQRGSAATNVLLFLVTVIGTLLIAYVLVTMFGNKQAARTPFVRVAEVNELSTDPEPWGLNWPRQFDGWKATAGTQFDGGADAMPQSKLDTQPWLKRLYAGYAFSIDYREARGHAYMLYDQGVTERVTKKPQAGACLHCHSANSVMYRKAGLEALGQPADDAALAADFNMPAVIRGFQEVSKRPYADVLTLLYQAPDGTPNETTPVNPVAPYGGFAGEMAGQGVDPAHALIGEAHPVSCIDCHDPANMKLRVTRPGFVLGIAALAAGNAPVPHLPSIGQWRAGDRRVPYDPNALASRQEMRSFACGQCHVEYYCANKDTLEFPWSQGLRAEDLEAHWAAKTFPDGKPFYDYTHGETGAPVFKVQHPEFELWSQGIHAQSGVSCADCHMPYEREGAMKLSNHNVQTPLANINNACQQCHNVSEADLRIRVETIQSKTKALMERAGLAMTDMLDAILQAKAAGATPEQLAPIFVLQRQAMWRLDYISSENSDGFHADQEAARLLGESIDLSRKATIAALRLRAPEAPSTSDLPMQPVIGVTPEKP